MEPFVKILDLCQAISSNRPDAVFIGGVAVYLHLVDRALSNMEPEASHDGDFMTSFADFGSLKDEVEITANPRLAKHQMIIEDVDFDIYVEHLNRLIIPYDEVYSQAIEIEQTRVACLEHLLMLKLDAFQARRQSSKGKKDRRDIVTIGLLLGRRTRKSLIESCMRDELIGFLQDMAKSSVFFELCSHNAHAAKKARASFAAFVSDVA